MVIAGPTSSLCLSATLARQGSSLVGFAVFHFAGFRHSPDSECGSVYGSWLFYIVPATWKQLNVNFREPTQDVSAWGVLAMGGVLNPCC